MRNSKSASMKPNLASVKGQLCNGCSFWRKPHSRMQTNPLPNMDGSIQPHANHLPIHASLYLASDTCKHGSELCNLALGRRDNSSGMIRRLDVLSKQATFAHSCFSAAAYSPPPLFPHHHTNPPHITVLD